MKYLICNGSRCGKWQLFDTIEQAIKICDKKNKTNKYKWFVWELPEDQAERYEKSRCFTPAKCKVVYDPEQQERFGY